MNQLFILSYEVIMAVTIEEAEATAAQLKELGLYHLPYEKVDIQMPWDGIAINADTGKPFPAKLGPEAYIRLLDVTTDGAKKIAAGCGKVYREDIACNPSQIDNFATLLIVLLATKNIIKTVKHCKLAKRGIGKCKYEYSTTLSIPKILDDDPDNATPGKPKAPHLRRGHIRRQHYGPRNSFIKSIWIEPCFVNADADFVSTRTHYNFGA